MKKPAKPGDFGTNGTRGVVGSGMSETTKNADTQSPRPSQEFREAIFREWVRQFTLKANGTPRPSTFAAEGGAERETTNSPAEIGAGCTGRKMALAKMSVCAAAILFILASIWAQAGFWIAWDAVGLIVWVNLFRMERASGGEGV